MSGVALVTGACGFIGRHAARRLARGGWSVSGIGHGRFDDAERERWGMRHFTSADVTLANLAACGAKPDLIVHCAGGSTVGYSLMHPLADFERTVTTTAAALEFARTQTAGARVVFLSSAAVYGDAGDQPLPEQPPEQAFVPARFREARDARGELALLHASQEEEILRGLPLVEVEEPR